MIICFLVTPQSRGIKSNYKINIFKINYIVNKKVVCRIFINA